MKVRNMKSNTGRAVPNQFVIVDDIFEVSTKQNVTVEYFQSYDSVIVKKVYHTYGTKICLDREYWDYSKTTGKYRKQFLGESKKETQQKIDDGTYLLTNLN